ncbi:hypothetical protein VP1G_00732 [Cytospora mali]|uniref:NAD(P)-binding domain-containing protein n=1 Tax=Cytospora mali TaxID=578113 RepID=A0A194UNX5_CYTMA|nr:hypothetical protein VP1G_00732 [Valsa mali var. pyri (nom. inval.)]
MHILLLGATGRTGIQVLTQALEHNHTITALVRNPDSLHPSSTLTLPPNHKTNLTLIKGNPLNTQDVQTAITTTTDGSHPAQAPIDIVISTLNPRRTSESPFAAVHPTDSPPRMMADSLGNILSALKAHQPDHKAKVVVLSALGAGGSAQNTNCLLRLMFRYTNMRYTYEDHDAVEAELRDAAGDGAVDFVIGDEGVARVFDADEGGVVGMMETVSRGAVARFLVDAAEGSEWDGRAPIIVG